MEEATGRMNAWPAPVAPIPPPPRPAPTRAIVILVCCLLGVAVTFWLAYTYQRAQDEVRDFNCKHQVETYGGHC